VPLTITPEEAETPTPKLQRGTDGGKIKPQLVKTTQMI